MPWYAAMCTSNSFVIGHHQHFTHTISFTDIGAILFHRSWIFTITRVFFHLHCRQSYHSLVNASGDAAGKNVPIMLQLIPMTNWPRLDGKYFNTIRNALMTHTLECRVIGRRGIRLSNHTPIKNFPILLDLHQNCLQMSCKRAVSPCADTCPVA